MVELFALLLPVAAASGWYAAYRKYRADHLRFRTASFHNSFTRGVELLLQDKMGEALEALSPVIQSEHEGLELRLAIGQLYRKKGLVETALAVHQGLAEHHGLTLEQREFVAFQLGMDYLAAGLLDRAEAAFRELLDSAEYRSESLRQLLKIYQRERDWWQAIECAKELRELQRLPNGEAVSQFYCELAHQAKEAGRRLEADRLLGLALDDNPFCVRANIARGILRMEAGDWDGAITMLAAIERQDPAFISEVLEKLATCFDHLNSSNDFHAQLRRMFFDHGNDEVACVLVDRLTAREGSAAARQFLLQALARSRSVKLGRELLRLMLQRVTGEERADLQLILRSCPDPLDEPRKYRCTRCGFQGQELHWNCPSCQHWATIKPFP